MFHVEARGDSAEGVVGLSPYPVGCLDGGHGAPVGGDCACRRFQRGWFGVVDCAGECGHGGITKKGDKWEVYAGGVVDFSLEAYRGHGVDAEVREGLLGVDGAVYGGENFGNGVGCGGGVHLVFPSTTSYRVALFIHLTLQVVIIFNNGHIFQRVNRGGPQCHPRCSHRHNVSL